MTLTLQMDTNSMDMILPFYIICVSYTMPQLFSFHYLKLLFLHIEKIIVLAEKTSFFLYKKKWYPLNM